MRDKSILWVVGGVVVVGALVAINLAVRTDPEPEFATSAPRTEGPAVAELREVPVDDAEEEPGPEVPEPAEPAEEAADTDPETEPLTCEHPFVPSTPGIWRRYAWRQSGEARGAALRIEALSARELPDGEREITWQVEVTADDDHSELASERMTTRCAPGHDAEEPWFGILERSLSLTLTEDPRWRWPARLRTGDRFEGTARFDPRGADMRIPSDVRGPQVLRVTRNHVVGEREPVEVPGGSYRAWRVEYEERHAFGDRGERGTGTVWVAPEVGMVKSRAENSEGVVQTIELVASGRRRR